MITIDREVVVCSGLLLFHPCFPLSGNIGSSDSMTAVEDSITERLLLILSYRIGGFAFKLKKTSELCYAVKHMKRHFQETRPPSMKAVHVKPTKKRR